MSLSQEELKKLHAECLKLPEGKNYRADDYIINLFVTVLDFQMNTDVVDAALVFYRENRRNQLPTHETLAEIISWYPDTKKGNTGRGTLFLSKLTWL